MSVRVLVFAPRELAELYAEAERLVLNLQERGLETCLINRSTGRVDDLLLVAKYGIVEPFVVVLTDASGVRARLTTVPSLYEVETVIMRIAHSPTPTA